VPEFYLVARIASTTGRNGFLNLISYSDFPDRFFELKEVYIDFFGNKKLFYIESIKKQKNSFTLKFRNFNSDKDASFLVNKELFVTEKDVAKIPEGTFFIHDLIGSKVFRQERELGTIKDVLKNPANDVYIISGIDGNEILIPAVLEFIEKFDPLKKVLVLKPGAGIYEDDEN